MPNFLPLRARFRRIFHRNRRFWGRRQTIAFCLACLLTFGFEKWLDSVVEEQGQHNIVTKPLFSIGSVYQRLVTAGPRKPEERFVVPVEITIAKTKEKKSIGTHVENARNLCLERRYIGALLKTLALFHPNVVVIDKYYGTDPCPFDAAAPPCAVTDNDTCELVEGIKSLCADEAKVVVGRAVVEDADPVKGEYYPLEDGYDFRENGAGCVQEALVNLDTDFRRVSLRSLNVLRAATVPESCGDVEDTPPASVLKSCHPPSLPLAAAIAYTDGLSVADWPDTVPPPYVSFIKPEQFVKLDSSEVLCGSRDNWRACEASDAKPALRDRVRGKVVIIGDNLPETDQHYTVVGWVPGYLLQANYIESLIDDRVFRPLPEGLDFGAGFVVFFWFEYLFWRYHGFQALIRVALLFCGVGAVVYLAATNAKYYFDPATTSVLAVLNSRIMELLMGKK
jgi:hypothetical protein